MNPSGSLATLSLGGTSMDPPGSLAQFSPAETHMNPPSSLATQSPRGTSMDPPGSSMDPPGSLAQFSPVEPPRDLGIGEHVSFSGDGYGDDCSDRFLLKTCKLRGSVSLNRFELD